MYASVVASTVPMVLLVMMLIDGCVVVNALNASRLWL